MEKTIAVLAGDGIGPEVMVQACRVLRVVAEKYNHTFHFAEALVGGAAYEAHGSHLPEETIVVCDDADAILFGSVGGPVSEVHLDKWKSCERDSILGLRKHFQFNANFRPVKVFPQLKSLCPLRPDLVEKGIDLLVVRELNGDIYFGGHERFERDGKRAATDTAEYTEDQIISVAHQAFEAARKRRNIVTSVDKANVLDTSKLWREVVREVAKDYSDVELRELLVDFCAMALITKPFEFDVILTTNMFGDILSDEAAVLPGSLGLLASSSINEEGFGLYEPPGGSAQDIAGQGKANPIGQIRSAGMLLRHAFGLTEEADAIEAAVDAVLDSGLRTGDIYTSVEGERLVGTEEMAEAIISKFQ